MLQNFGYSRSTEAEVRHSATRESAFVRVTLIAVALTFLGLFLVVPLIAVFAQALHKGVAAALRYAQALSPSVRAVYVELDPDKTNRLEEKWGKWGLGAPLVVLTSPYRSLLTPFLDYVDHLLALGENHVVTIVIPEFVPARWWQHLLHNQTALLIKGALLFRKRVVVVDVPFHLHQ